MAIRHEQAVWRIRKVLKDARLDVKREDIPSNEGDCTRLTAKSGKKWITVDITESILPPEEECW